MRLRRHAAVSCLVLALLASQPVSPQDVPAAPTPSPPTGAATLVVGERSIPLQVGRTAVGPLVELGPVAAALGGTVEPLADTAAWILELQGTRVVLGPGSQVATVDQEIWNLSQPPLSRDTKILVPLDLLRRLYGGMLGWTFEWNEATAVLRVERGERREIPLSVSAVQLEGLTTVVLEFATPPRHHIERSEQHIRVDLAGDVARLVERPELPAGSLVRRLDISPERILLYLAAGAQVDDYVLNQPFRLVFDVYAAAPAGPETPDLDRPEEGSGIQTIVVDPGHGGEETGAVGPGGSMEKDLTLILSRELERRLETRLPVEVLLTRGEDEELSLADRTAFANANKADIFLSVHLNSTPGGTAHGAETYFLSLTASDEAAAAAAASENRSDGSGDELELILWDLAQSRHLAESQRLAKQIQGELNRSLGLDDRGVKQAPFLVLKGAAMPAILVELGFINNPADEERLNDPDYRDELIAALVRAISRFHASFEEPPVRAADSNP